MGHFGMWRDDEAFATVLTAAQAGGSWAFERLYASLAPAVAGTCGPKAPPTMTIDQ